MKKFGLLLLMVMAFGGLLKDAYSTNESERDAMEGCSFVSTKPSSNFNQVDGLSHIISQKRTLTDLPREVFPLLFSHLSAKDVLKLAFSSRELRLSIIEGVNLNWLENGLLRENVPPKNILALGMAGQIPFDNGKGVPGFGTASWNLLDKQPRTTLITSSFSGANPIAKEFIGMLLFYGPSLDLGNLLDILGHKGFDSPLYPSLQPYITGLHISFQDVQGLNGRHLSQLFPNLKALGISFFSVKLVGVLFQILQELPQMPYLTALNLSHNWIGEGPNGLAQMERLLHVLATTTNLTALNLGANDIGVGPKAMEKMEILRQILAPLNKLTSLILYDNSLVKDSQGLEKMEVLGQILAPKTNLTILDLGGNGIGNGQNGLAVMNILQQTLAPLTKLTSLKLYANSLAKEPQGLEKMRVLCQTLAPLTNLNILNISCNWIGLGSDGAAQKSILSHVFASLTKLSNLSLGQNKFGQEEGKVLYDALRKTSPCINIDFL